MKRIHLLALLAFVLPVSARAADAPKADDPPFPILAWGGPPADQTTMARYRELAGAGFTHNYSGFPSADAMGKALDVARETGLKLLVSCPELTRDPEATAKRFKDHPALGGYYLRDEPPAGDFAGLPAWARRVQSVDAAHPCYVNLFPNYATAEQLGAATYAQYVGRFVKEVPVPVLSFDHYPVVGTTLRPEWYENLEIVSSAARREKKPFCAFALSVAHGPYPVPTAAHLRVQVFSNLAYGAQGLQYFTYWTGRSDTWDFHEAPIDVNGSRTPVYDRVREVNRRVRALRGVFLGAAVESVGHTGETPPRGTRRFEPAAPVKSLQTSGAGAVVSVLAKGRQKFLVVVNRDIAGPMNLRIEFEPAAGVERLDEDAGPRPVGGSDRRDVEPGDVAVYRWAAETK